MIFNRDILSNYMTEINYPCSRLDPGARDHKEVQEHMNKYELAVVVSAKLEDEARAASHRKSESI